MLHALNDERANVDLEAPRWPQHDKLRPASRTRCSPRVARSTAAVAEHPSAECVAAQHAATTRARQGAAACRSQPPLRALRACHTGGGAAGELSGGSCFSCAGEAVAICLGLACLGGEGVIGYPVYSACKRGPGPRPRDMPLGTAPCVDRSTAAPRAPDRAPSGYCLRRGRRPAIATATARPTSDGRPRSAGMRASARRSRRQRKPTRVPLAAARAIARHDSAARRHWR